MSDIDVARSILFPARLGRPVHRAWDIGVSDTTIVTWFSDGHVLHKETFSGHGLAELVPIVASSPLGPIGNDFVRPDAECQNWSDGKTLVHHMQELGLRPVVVPTEAEVQPGQDASVA